MFINILLFLCIQIIVFSAPIGFSFGREGENPRQILDQSLYQDQINLWRHQEVSPNIEANQRRVHRNFKQEPKIDFAEEVPEEIELEESDFTTTSLHEMFSHSPSYISNIYYISEQYNYELDEGIYNSVSASSSDNIDDDRVKLESSAKNKSQPGSVQKNPTNKGDELSEKEKSKEVSEGDELSEKEKSKEANEGDELSEKEKSKEANEGDELSEKEKSKEANEGDELSEKEKSKL
ncbi:MAG: hypothetical protein COB02_13370 [Candidatus Cloacimonadota bacterium]|nr:MAG: hypothetical protein COB02_13370 [Candidatus Cloacimonadota bacterium]